MSLEMKDFKPEEIFEFIQKQSGNIDIQSIMKANNRFVYALTDYLNSQLRIKENEWAIKELTSGNAEFLSADEAMKLIKKAFTESQTESSLYDPEFGDNKLCKCGHKYHRHFDSYDSMNPVGCKYCDCRSFKD